MSLLAIEAPIYETEVNYTVFLEGTLDTLVVGSVGYGDTVEASIRNARFSLTGLLTDKETMGDVHGIEHFTAEEAFYAAHNAREETFHTVNQVTPAMVLVGFDKTFDDMFPHDTLHKYIKSVMNEVTHKTPRQQDLYNAYKLKYGA